MSYLMGFHVGVFSPITANYLETSTDLGYCTQNGNGINQHLKNWENV